MKPCTSEANMRIELEIDGVKTPFELDDEGKLTTIKGERKTGWERVENGEEYFCLNYPFIRHTEDKNLLVHEQLFKIADYFNDEKIRDNLNRAFEIWRKILQWQALNDEPVINYRFGWTFYYNEEQNNIFLLKNPPLLIPGILMMFTTREKAEECLKIFKNDLLWLARDFYTRLDERKK